VIDDSDKTKYSAIFLWCLIMYCKTPQNSELETDGGRYHLGLHRNIAEMDQALVAREQPEQLIPPGRGKCRKMLKIR
jgi:hypothetical protein